MTPVDDLVAWLTQIWDEQEKQAERAVGDVAAMEIDNYGHLTVPASWVLARIAADRQILALHSPDDGLCFWTNSGWETHGDYAKECFPDGWACDTLKALASPYADRPGFRDEWRVTA